MSCKTIQSSNYSTIGFNQKSTIHNISDQNKIEFLHNNQMKFKQIAYNQILNQLQQQLPKQLNINYDDYQQESTCEFDKEYQSFSNFDEQSDIQSNNYCDVDNKEQEDEEEFSIWSENDFDKLGISQDNFRDNRGNQLEFYQLYRLRSVLYQPNYVSRFETIKEVLQISQHFGKKISASVLKQQQIYLDNYFLVQEKDEDTNAKYKKQIIQKK